jgi:endonuclease I
MLKRYSMLNILLFWVVAITAQIPAGYYNQAEGKKDAALKTALYLIIKDHTQLEYYSTAGHFRNTDWHPNGYYWDMYSNNKRTSWTGMNREHSLPKSWFGISGGQENTAAIATDLHNLYPSDVTANSEKSNYPLGETNGNTFNNGVSKVGSSTFSGYNGMVFEPADEYKGDFARTYMYMVTCYEDYASVWRSTGTASMLYQNTYPTFRPYAVNLLLKWHRNDPVSEKEINRNNEVYKVQRNRNPFIDHPVLAEFIWGYNKGENWDSSKSSTGGPEFFSVHYQYQTKKMLVRLIPAQTVTYRIAAINGQVVETGQLTSSITSTIPVSHLPGGSYIVMVETTVNRFTRIILIH